MSLKRERQPGLDIIRTIAAIFVLTTHSITLSGIIDRSVGSPKLLAVLLVRFAAMSSVPLFIMLTGYLSSEKKLSPKYYAGIIPVLISYLTISALCAVGKLLFFDAYQSVGAALISIFDFTANTYAWYVEMYIGLFLLIPFLNILWQSLAIRARAVLIATLAFLTLLPAIAGSFIVCERYLDIVPDYWEIIYPITYYYIGAFIREYKPSLKKSIGNVYLRLLVGAAAVAAAAFVPAFICYISSSESYAWYVMNGFGCLTNGVTALLIFILFYDMECLPLPAAVFKEFSVCSFEMYLISAVADTVVYGYLSFPLPIMLGAVFVLSYVGARLLRFVLCPISRKLTSALLRA